MPSLFHACAKGELPWHDAHFFWLCAVVLRAARQTRFRVELP